jgi:hypothetical protein
MTDAPFPVLVMIHSEPLNPARHEILLVHNTTAYLNLHHDILTAIYESPNTEEYLAKYSSGTKGKALKKLTVHWGPGRDPKNWPDRTIVTNKNWEAIKPLLRAGVGKDSLEAEFE